MADTAVRVKNLFKQYTIGVAQSRPDTLRDWLAHAVEGVCSRNGNSKPHARSFWALKDVSFEIERGEVAGIIGRNGAGKSTLLKILSRITEPTRGHAEIHGRVGSLLEVGTGFHQELTGRENIYLSGAILGMKKSEIDSKFDEIVSFSEVENFIDTPVKHYSSGMYLRLAFAVAAHLEPEILLVDEVLAVGDAMFQRKCLGKMENVAKQGRTVLFVSHNMLAIQSLCTKAILLKEGTVALEGTPEQVVTSYLASVEQLQMQPLASRKDRNAGEVFRFVNVEFLNPQTMTSWDMLVSGKPLVIRITYESKCDNVLDDVGVSIGFYGPTGALLCSCRSRAVGVTLDLIPGTGYTYCKIPKLPLKAGRYSYNLFAERRNFPLDDIRDAGVIHVESGDYYGSGHLPAAGQPAVLIDYAWQK